VIELPGSISGVDAAEDTAGSLAPLGEEVENVSDTGGEEDAAEIDSHQAGDENPD
jgi:hypothetical protein